MNDGVQKAASCTAMGRKLLTLPGIAVRYTFLMNTWNRLLESYQQRVYTNSSATVNHPIQQAENPMPAELLSTEAVSVDIASLLHDLTSEVVVEKSEIRSIDPNFVMNTNCMDAKFHFRMPGGSEDNEDERDEIDKRDAFPTVSQSQWATTDLKSFELETSAGDGCECYNTDDVNVDAEQDASQAADGSTHKLEYCRHCTRDWRHSTRECQDCPVYFRPMKYYNGKADAMGSDVSEAKTVLYYVTTSQSSADT